MKLEALQKESIGDRDFDAVRLAAELGIERRLPEIAEAVRSRRQS
jgi:hypothetical protein